MIRHIAMFKFRPEVTQSEREAARDALASNKEYCPTVRDYLVGLDLGRKPQNWREQPAKFDMVLIADFDDIAALEAYSVDPHKKEMAKINNPLTIQEAAARIQIEY